MADRSWPTIWGAEGEGETPPEEDGGSQDEGTEEVPESKSYTVDEINAMTARAADRASRTASKKLAQDLGYESVTGMKEAVTKQREAAENAKSEEQKRLDEIEAREAAAIERDRVSLARERQASIKLAISSEGITDQKRAARILSMVQTEVGPDVESDDLEEAVAEALVGIKADVPELFAAASGHGSGDGGSSGRSTDEDTDEDQEQEERFEEEHRQKGRIIADLSAMLPGR
jgi:hypothetical protein